MNVKIYFKNGERIYIKDIIMIQTIGGKLVVIFNVDDPIKDHVLTKYYDMYTIEAYYLSTRED